MEKTAPGKHSSNPSPVLLAPACCSSTVMPCMLLAARRLWYLTPLPPPPLQMLSGARGSGPCDLSTPEKWWGGEDGGKALLSNSLGIGWDQ